MHRPYLLLAELTYRCPLHCPYCSNPVGKQPRPELSTGDWEKVLQEAADLGALHVGFSGGEPLQRPDLEQLVAVARNVGLYSNLITSAIGLSRNRLQKLKEAGLDSVQISFQADEPELGDKIAGTCAHNRKLEAARSAREIGFPLTVNVVLHRANIGRLDQIISLAQRLEADRLELANTQYYGWAFRNRAQLLPTRLQIEEAIRVTTVARERLAGKLEILFVVPDYYSDRPKPCMHGWGSRYLTVNSAGDVLPCPTASDIPQLQFDNVRGKSLEWIWHNSEAFNRFRGTDWMPEPCQSCELREIDFAGCRCQAALITGNAAATDPACELSPHRYQLSEFVEAIQNTGSAQMHFEEGIVFRQNPA